MNNNDFYIKNNALQPDNSKKGKSKVLPILILVLLVGVAGFLAYELKFKKDDTKKSDEYVEYDPNYNLEDGQNKNEQGDNDGSDDLIDVENPKSDDNSKSNSSPGNILSNIVSNANKDSNNQTSNVPGVTKTIPVTGIKLNVSKLTISKNGTARLTSTITPSNATNKGVTWKSSNSSVVSVDQNGKVTAKNYGTATITVTSKDGGKSAKAVINVPQPSVKSIAISTSSSTIYVGNVMTASISYNPSDAANRSVTWKSSDASIATVNSKGAITGVSEGDVTITATTPNGVTTSKKFNIRENPANFTLHWNPLYSAGHHGALTISAYSPHVYKNNSTYKYEKIIFNGKTYYQSSSPDKSELNQSIKTATVVTPKGNNIYNVKVVFDN